MRGRLVLGSFVLAAAWVSASAWARPAFAADSPAAGPRIVVGPNQLVSRDGDFPHVELMVAANPKNAKNLIGTAITGSRPNGGQACRTYSSFDGGSSWTASEFPEQVELGGGDPQVAFTPQGTAIFMALGSARDETTGKPRGAFYVYRSEDGGRTWKMAAELGRGYDHEQLTVDTSFGRYAGRLYVGVLWDYPVYRVGVFRSEDDGRTWIGPVESANGGGTIGINDVNLMVLSDGMLVVPYGDFEFRPEKRGTHGPLPSTTWLVTSSDGGLTFSKPKKIVTAVWNQDDRDAGGFPALAADSQSKEFRDRIYIAWIERVNDKPRLLFSYSTDRGDHWSRPTPLDASVPAATRQFQPVVAVNKDGVVAVTWFDTRDAADGKQFHEYFAASVDGGRTFLPARRLSSAPSIPARAGNALPQPTVFRYKDSLYLSSTSASSRWGSGGDYMGLTADRDGVFHPFWADARSGTFQIFSARVEVVRPEAPAPDKKAAAAPPPPPGKRTEASLLDRVEFVFDPPRYDAATKQLEYFVRIKNTSTAPIYPPIRVEVVAFGFEDFQSEEQKRDDAANAPSVLTSSNGKTGVGAAIDFGAALGDLDALEPGAQTGPVPLKLQLVDPLKMPQVRLQVTGTVGEGK